jgi:uncharacterized RDD family membrane protein YckC
MANGQPGYGGPYGSRAGGAIPIEATEGVLGPRLFAYLLDIVFILIFSGLLALAISIIGLLTFGLGWALFAIMPAAGVIYSAITVGGSKQSTIGMRMMGLRAVDAATGGRVDWIIAAIHSLLFYVAAGTFLLWVLDLFIGFTRTDHRLGHDLLVGLAVVRRF